MKTPEAVLFASHVLAEHIWQGEDPPIDVVPWEAYHLLEYSGYFSDRAALYEFHYAAGKICNAWLTMREYHAKGGE